jgi:hypothetical protein
MELLKSGNVILRFLLELCVLVAELVIFAAGVAPAEHALDIT